MNGSSVVGLLSLLGLGACSDATPSAPSAFTEDAGASEDAATEDALGSCDTGTHACGQPCDRGNALGVGHYCQGLSDCKGMPAAHICSDLGDPTTHFCTLICTPDSGSACGEGAACVCNDGDLCGCTPRSCLGP